MDPLVIVHVVIGVALVVLAALVGMWGLVRARRLGVAGRTREARSYAQLLQLVHTLVFAQIVLGLLMLAEGHRVADRLHVNVYGVFMLVAIVASYAYRTRDATTNVRVFAVSSLIIFALGLRAMWTGA